MQNSYVSCAKQGENTWASSGYWYCTLWTSLIFKCPSWQIQLFLAFFLMAFSSAYQTTIPPGSFINYKNIHVRDIPKLSFKFIILAGKRPFQKHALDTSRLTWKSGYQRTLYEQKKERSNLARFVHSGFLSDKDALPLLSPILYKEKTRFKRQLQNITPKESVNDFQKFFKDKLFCCGDSLPPDKSGSPLKIVSDNAFDQGGLEKWFRDDPQLNWDAVIKTPPLNDLETRTAENQSLRIVIKSVTTLSSLTTPRHDSDRMSVNDGINSVIPSSQQSFKTSHSIPLFTSAITPVLTREGPMPHSSNSHTFTNTDIDPHKNGTLPKKPLVISPSQLSSISENTVGFDEASKLIIPNTSNLHVNTPVFKSTDKTLPVSKTGLVSTSPTNFVGYRTSATASSFPYYGVRYSGGFLKVDGAAEKAITSPKASTSSLNQISTVPGSVSSLMHHRILAKPKGEKSNTEHTRNANMSTSTLVYRYLSESNSDSFRASITPLYKSYPSNSIEVSAEKHVSLQPQMWITMERLKSYAAKHKPPGKGSPSTITFNGYTAEYSSGLSTSLWSHIEQKDSVTNHQKFKASALLAMPTAVTRESSYLSNKVTNSSFLLHKAISQPNTDTNKENDSHRGNLGKFREHSTSSYTVSFKVISQPPVSHLSTVFKASDNYFMHNTGRLSTTISNLSPASGDLNALTSEKSSKTSSLTFFDTNVFQDFLPNKGSGTHLEGLSVKSTYSTGNLQAHHIKSAITPSLSLKTLFVPRFRQVALPVSSTHSTEFGTENTGTNHPKVAITKAIHSSMNVSFGMKVRSKHITENKGVLNPKDMTVAFSPVLSTSLVPNDSQGVPSINSTHGTKSGALNIGDRHPNIAITTDTPVFSTSFVSDVRQEARTETLTHNTHFVTMKKDLRHTKKSVETTQSPFFSTSLVSDLSQKVQTVNVTNIKFGTVKRDLGHLKVEMETTTQASLLSTSVVPNVSQEAQTVNYTQSTQFGIAKKDFNRLKVATETSTYSHLLSTSIVPNVSQEAHTVNFTESTMFGIVKKDSRRPKVAMETTTYSSFINNSVVPNVSQEAHTVNFTQSTTFGIVKKDSRRPKVAMEITTYSSFINNSVVPNVSQEAHTVRFTQSTTFGTVKKDFHHPKVATETSTYSHLLSTSIVPNVSQEAHTENFTQSTPFGIVKKDSRRPKVAMETTTYSSFINNSVVPNVSQEAQTVSFTQSTPFGTVKKDSRRPKVAMETSTYSHLFSTFVIPNASQEAHTVNVTQSIPFGTIKKDSHHPKVAMETTTYSPLLNTSLVPDAIEKVPTVNFTNFTQFSTHHPKVALQTTTQSMLYTSLVPDVSQEGQYEGPTHNTQFDTVKIDFRHPRRPRTTTVSSPILRTSIVLDDIPTTLHTTSLLFSVINPLIHQDNRATSIARMDISTLSLQTETLDSTLLPRILTPEAGLIVARAKETLPRTITPFFSTIAAFLATRSLNFRLTGILYTEQLQNVSSDEYLRLAREVKLVMNKIFSSRYPEGYMQCYVGSFLNGSVIVKAYVSFNNRLPAPSSSDVVRSVVTDIKAKQTYFGWNIDPHSVESHGRTLKNLEPEMFSVSLLVLHCGFIVTSQMSEENISLLENLKQEVIFSFPGSINVSNFSISSVRDVLGDLEVKGNLYLNSTVHTDVQSLLQAFTPLSNKSVDLSSVNVDGHYMNLQVFPIRFQITNKPFVVNLLDLSSSEFQDLSKDLSAVVMSVLSITKPLQVIIREVMRGSVLCKGVVVYQLPAPGSGEILRAFLGSLDSNGMFKSSSYKVDRYSLQVGDSSPEPHFEYPSFPGFGVAIIVMCGLSILIFPTLAYVCFRTKMLGHKKKATIQRCLDPDRQSRHFEMDNQAFRASIEQP